MPRLAFAAAAVLPWGGALAATAAECPKVSILAQASNLLRTRPGAGSGEAATVYRLDVPDARAACALNADGSLAVRVRIAITARRGAAGDGFAAAPAQYFIAVTQTDMKVLSRGAFDVSVPMDAKGGGILTDDTVTLPAGQAPGTIEIVVGIDPEKSR